MKQVNECYLNWWPHRFFPASKMPLNSPLSPLLTFPMTAAGGIDAKADISENMKIYFLFLFSLIPLSLPPSSCCSSSLIREGVLTSPAAEVWPTDWLGNLKALLGMHCSWVYVCVCVCTYCLHHSFCRLGEAVRLIRVAGWAWLTHTGSSQAVRAVALRGGPFHLHCPSQGSPSRGLDRGEARVLPELEAGGGSEKGGSIFMKATPNLWTLEKTVFQNSNVSNKMYNLMVYLLISHQICLVRYSAAIRSTILNAPLALLLLLRYSVNTLNSVTRCLSFSDRWYCLVLVLFF